MAQINTLTVAVTNGSSLVTAAAGVDWTGFQNGTLAFWVSGSNASYGVAAVRAPAQNVSGRWELNLAANYSGTTNAAATYYLTNSFSPILQLPLLAYGDAQGNIAFSRAMLLIEALIVGLQAAGGLKFGGAANANVQLDAEGNLMIRNVTTGAFRYPAFVGQAGQEVEVALETYTGILALDQNNNLLVRNTSTGASLYPTINGGVGAEILVGSLIYAGAQPNWQVDAQGNLQIFNTTTNSYQYPTFVGEPGGEYVAIVNAYAGVAPSWSKDSFGNIQIRNTTTGALRYGAFQGQAGAQVFVPLNAPPGQAV